MTYALDLHRSGGRRSARRRESGHAPRPRWTAPQPPDQTASDAAAPPAAERPAFRRLVVFGSLDSTVDRPAT